MTLKVRLPTPSEKYDAQNERELRRQLELAFAQDFAGSGGRTMAFPFGNGSNMESSGAYRVLSLGAAYRLTQWRLRAFDSSGLPTAVTCAMTVTRRTWGDVVTSAVGDGTAPSLTAATKNRGDPFDWTGASGTPHDTICATLASITIGSCTALLLTLDFE